MYNPSYGSSLFTFPSLPILYLQLPPVGWPGESGARQALQALSYHHVSSNSDGGPCQGRSPQDAGGGSQECQ